MEKKTGKQTDIFGNTPEIGDFIVFNPAKYKGLIYGICVGFSTAGLPEVNVTEVFGHIGQKNKSGYYTPKTGFVIKGK